MPPVAFTEHIMPYYDSFDICTAYYHFADLPIGVKRASKIVNQLERLRYRPGLSASRLHRISPNAKKIYMNLVRKHYGR